MECRLTAAWRVDDSFGRYVLAFPSTLIPCVNWRLAYYLLKETHLPKDTALAMGNRDSLQAIQTELPAPLHSMATVSMLSKYKPGWWWSPTCFALSCQGRSKATFPSPKLRLYFVSCCDVLHRFRVFHGEFAQWWADYLGWESQCSIQRTHLIWL